MAVLGSIAVRLVCISAEERPAVFFHHRLLCVDLGGWVVVRMYLNIHSFPFRIGELFLGTRDGANAAERCLRAVVVSRGLRAKVGVLRVVVVGVFPLDPEPHNRNHISIEGHSKSL